MSRTVHPLPERHGPLRRGDAAYLIVKAEVVDTAVWVRERAVEERDEVVHRQVAEAFRPAGGRRRPGGVVRVWETPRQRVRSDGRVALAGLGD
jgi:hypothetical protein